jgi:hypothetical protein
VLHGVGSGAEHSKWLITHFPAVAVGTMKEVAAPAFAEARNPRQLVCRSGRDQQPPCPQRLAIVEGDREGGFD